MKVVFTLGMVVLISAVALCSAQGGLERSGKSTFGFSSGHVRQERVVQDQSDNLGGSTAHQSNTGFQFQSGSGLSQSNTGSRTQSGLNLRGSTIGLTNNAGSTTHQSNTGFLFQSGSGLSQSNTGSRTQSGLNLQGSTIGLTNNAGSTAPQSNTGFQSHTSGSSSSIHGSFGERISGRTPVPIISEERNGPDAQGAYSFRYESGDGTRREEIGRPTSSDAIAVQGSYSYVSPDGTPVEVRYVADELGFRAEGSHLPTPPPAPLHSLQQIQAAEAAFSRQGQDQRLRGSQGNNAGASTSTFQQQGSFQTQSGLNSHGSTTGFQSHRGSNVHQSNTGFQSHSGSDLVRSNTGVRTQSGFSSLGSTIGLTNNVGSTAHQSNTGVQSQSVSDLLRSNTGIHTNLGSSVLQSNSGFHTGLGSNDFQSNTGFQTHSGSKVLQSNASVETQSGSNASHSNIDFLTHSGPIVVHLNTNSQTHPGPNVLQSNTSSQAHSVSNLLHSNTSSQTHFGIDLDDFVSEIEDNSGSTEQSISNFNAHSGKVSDEEIDQDLLSVIQRARSFESIKLEPFNCGCGESGEE